MADFAVFVEGVDNLQFADSLGPKIALAAQRAINRTADRTRTESARRIRREVAFPAAYLNPGAGRLTVAKRASGDHLEATVRGQFRPTSLARFVVGTPRGGGVRVQVQPGIARFMRRAFLIRLPQGSGNVETKFNKGLAIRLRPGETLENKKAARKIASGLYLLYGPSVDQVFRTVAVDVAPGAATQLEKEFLRLLEI